MGNPSDQLVDKILAGWAAGATIMCALYNSETGSFPITAADDKLQDLGGTLTRTPVNLETITTTGGVLDAADTLLTAVTGTFDNIVVVQFFGSGDWDILAWWTITPTAASSEDVLVEWDEDGILAIAECP